MLFDIGISLVFFAAMFFSVNSLVEIVRFAIYGSTGREATAYFTVWLLPALFWAVFFFLMMRQSHG